MGATSSWCPVKNEPQRAPESPRNKEGKREMSRVPHWPLLWPFGSRRSVWHSGLPLLNHSHKLWATQWPCFLLFSFLSLPFLFPSLFHSGFFPYLILSFIFLFTLFSFLSLFLYLIGHPLHQFLSLPWYHIYKLDKHSVTSKSHAFKNVTEVKVQQHYQRNVFKVCRIL